MRVIIACIAAAVAFQDAACFSPSPLAKAGLGIRQRSSACPLSSVKAQASSTSTEDMVSLGNMQVSSVGIGAWSWGDALFWGYDEKMEGDAKLAYDAVGDALPLEAREIGVRTAVFLLMPQA